MLLIFGDNKEFIDWNSIIYYKYYININILSSARQLSLLPCLSKSSASELILSWYQKIKLSNTDYFFFSSFW